MFVSSQKQMIQFENDEEVQKIAKEQKKYILLINNQIKLIRILIIAIGYVYDVTEFEDHPGGKYVFINFNGKSIDDIFFNTDYHFHDYQSYQKLQKYRCGVLLKPKVKQYKINSSNGVDIILNKIQSYPLDSKEALSNQICYNHLRIPSQREARVINQQIQENKRRRQVKEEQESFKSKLQQMKTSMGPYKINNTKEVQSKAQNMDDSVITPMTPLTPQNNSPVPVNQEIVNQLQGINAKLMKKK